MSFETGFDDCMFEGDFTGLICDKCGAKIDEGDRYFKDICTGAGIEAFEILCNECFEIEEN